MKELDELLLHYLEHRFDAAPDDEKAAFRSLLELSDPELIGDLLNKETPDPEFAVVVQNLLERPHT